MISNSNSRWQRQAASMFFAGLIGLVSMVGAANLQAQDDDAKRDQKSKKAQKIAETILIEMDRLRVPAPDKDGFVMEQQFDVDGDGRIDIQIRRKSGRGSLSTYYTITQMVAVNGAEFLKSGKPQDKGSTISAGDLVSTTRTVTLCSVGGSLRFPERSFEEFSFGTWWGKQNKGLALLIRDGQEIKIGFANMTVTKLGAVSFGKANFSRVDLPVVKF